MGGVGGGATGRGGGVRRWAGWALGVASTALGYLAGVVSLTNPIIGAAIAGGAIGLRALSIVISSSAGGFLGQAALALSLAGTLGGVFGLGAFAAQATLASLTAGFGSAISGLSGGC